MRLCQQFLLVLPGEAWEERRPFLLLYRGEVKEMTGSSAAEDPEASSSSTFQSDNQITKWEMTPIVDGVNTQF